MLRDVLKSFISMTIAHIPKYSIGSGFTKEPGSYSCFGATNSAFGAGIDPNATKARRGMNSFLSRVSICHPTARELDSKQC